LRRVALRCVALRCAALRCVAVRCIAHHITPHHTTPHHTTPHHITPHHTTSHTTHYTSLLHTPHITPHASQLDENGDPPRVWDKSLKAPGCAFTRSLGDSVAEAVGVSAEPEMLTYDLKSSDRFAIIASDGVFEFMTSQAVVDMIGDKSFSSIQEAANCVVSESYMLWVRAEGRTDDITIIVLDFKNYREVSCASPRKVQLEGLTNTPAKAPPAQLGQRPVRKVTNTQIRTDIMEAFDGGSAEHAAFDLSSVEDTKTASEKTLINTMLESNFLFSSLRPEQRDLIVKVMSLQLVTAGDEIIREGDTGDALYIIDSGEYSVLKADERGNDRAIFKYTAAGSSFGELSLMYGKPRSATVRCEKAGGLWVIARTAFRAVLTLDAMEHGGMMKDLRTIPCMEKVSARDLQRLCLASYSKTFELDETFLKMEDQMLKPANWVLGIITHGLVTLSPMTSTEVSVAQTRRRGSIITASAKKGGKKQTRGRGNYILAEEIGSRFTDATIGEAGTKITFIPAKAFTEVLTADGDRELIEVSCCPLKFTAITSTPYYGP
jgi:CRP-like cAMP-binding protein